MQYIYQLHSNIARGSYVRQHMALAQGIERPHGFHTKTATTEVLNEQQRSADNAWSSSHEFRWTQKSYFKVIEFCEFLHRVVMPEGYLTLEFG